MKQIQGVWLPDGETHMVEIMTGPAMRVVEGKITYQYRKLERALAEVPADRRRTCVDIGAHVGTWSMWLTHAFAYVHAFEPVAAHRECFYANVAAANCQLHPVALGAEAGRVAMAENPASTGSAHVRGAGDIEMRTLDSYQLPDVDFIKIDVEGLELEVCQGAIATIQRCRPVMVVEQKGRDASNYGTGRRDLALGWLEGLGMKRRTCLSGDWILGW